MGSWLLLHKEAIHSVGEITAAVGVVATTAGIILGGIFALIQYVKGNQLRAAETLLKVEEEFRAVLPALAQIEDVKTFERVIVPVLEAERTKVLDDGTLTKLVALDRALRFLYFCTVLNDSLGVDKAFGVSGGALQRAYYHYFRFLLPDNRAARPQLLDYTDREYPRLTAWVKTHADQLRG